MSILGFRCRRGVLFVPSVDTLGGVNGWKGPLKSDNIPIRFDCLADKGASS